MHARLFLVIVTIVLLILTSCGTPDPSAEVAQLTPGAPRSATATPRRPSATARSDQPTPRPATPTVQRPSPTSEPTSVTGAAPTPVLAAATAIVVNGGNVRLIPATGEPLDQVYAHEQVPLIGKNADASWYLLVTARGVTGWVSATLLNIESASIAQVPVVPETTQGQPASGPASDGWTTHSIGEGTIRLPSDWQTTTLTGEDFGHISKPMEAYPALADSAQKLAETDQFQLLTLLAMDPATTRNVSILGFPLTSDMPPDQLSRLVTNLGKAESDIKVLSRDSKRQVNGLPAGRITYEIAAGVLNRPGPVRGVQWNILGARLWIMTTIGPVDDDLILLADQIAQSFTEGTASGERSPAERRQVINGGNLRQDPEVRAGNVIGQVCPGDQMVVQDGGHTPGWAAVRVEATGPDCVSDRVPVGAEGWVSTSLLGPVAQDGADALPPSLPITRLVPFTHAPTGITGLRPENWTLFDNGLGFQISSSPEAPDGLTASVTEPPDAGPDGALTFSRAMFAEFKRNHAAGPPPEILEEQLNPDGSGVLVVTLSAQAQGSTQSVRLTAYLRTTITPRGLLMVVASVPAAQYSSEEALLRQMVDSVHVIE